MDYEKKYNEALKRAKQKIDSGFLTEDDLSYIFPELRESEDERIRKGLVKLLTVASEAYLVESTGIKKDSYLSYLEKQKEQKPAEWSEGDDLMMQSVYETLYDHQCVIRTGKMGKIDRDYVAAIDKQIAWLKSLRPSWKPSEQDELMKLKYAGTSTKLD